MATTYQHIASNTRKTWGLVLLFPLVFTLMTTLLIGGVLFLMGTSDPDIMGHCTMNGHPCPPEMSGLIFAGFFSAIIAAGCWVLASVWMAISYFFGDKWLLSGAGAVPISEQNFPEIYRLVENLCLSRGLPVPRIFLMQDDSLNAFATGRDPQHASIVLTTGIVAKLDRAELEGVIAHELSHVENRDIRLMLICVAGIAFFAFVGEVLVRSGSRSKKNGALVLVVGLVFLLYGYIFAPLIRLALSRRREYQADASAALMTRNPAALASALRKISGDCRVEALDKHASMAAMCIANPLKSSAWLSNLMATHPPIEKRIAALEEMDRGF